MNKSKMLAAVALVVITVYALSGCVKYRATDRGQAEWEGIKAEFTEPCTLDYQGVRGTIVEGLANRELVNRTFEACMVSNTYESARSTKESVIGACRATAYDVAGVTDLSEIIKDNWYREIYSDVIACGGK